MVKVSTKPVAMCGKMFMNMANTEAFSSIQPILTHLATKLERQKGGRSKPSVILTTCWFAHSIIQSSSARDCSWHGLKSSNARLRTWGLTRNWFQCQLINLERNGGWNIITNLDPCTFGAWNKTLITGKFITPCRNQDTWIINNDLLHAFQPDDLSLHSPTKRAKRTNICAKRWHRPQQNMQSG